MRAPNRCHLEIKQTFYLLMINSIYKLISINVATMTKNIRKENYGQNSALKYVLFETFTIISIISKLKSKNLSFKLINDPWKKAKEADHSGIGKTYGIVFDSK